MTLLSKKHFLFESSNQNTTMKPITRVKFPSYYGRDALCTEALIAAPNSSTGQSLSAGPSREPGKRLRLINLHLDSLRSTLPYRRDQMATVGGILRETSSDAIGGQPTIGIAAGDFNALSSLDDEFIPQNGLIDVWAYLRAKQNPKCDEDSQGYIQEKHWNHLRLGRLDRIAITEGLEALGIENIRPGTVELPIPGKEKGKKVRWSDHSGLRCFLQLKD
ncbi:hypothetical protein HJFPF1_05968 [Paramyrothecium foliicola]|nr:hypothetical protein HJFPF1_05968 [Paramyrothecium foliicola]